MQLFRVSQSIRQTKSISTAVRIRRVTKVSDRDREKSLWNSMQTSRAAERQAMNSDLTAWSSQSLLIAEYNKGTLSLESWDLELLDGIWRNWTSLKFQIQNKFEIWNLFEIWTEPRKFGPRNYLMDRKFGTSNYLMDLSDLMDQEVSFISQCTLNSPNGATTWGKMFLWSGFQSKICAF